MALEGYVSVDQNLDLPPAVLDRFKTKGIWNMDHITPLMFGAVGDGVADDTIPVRDAIQAAKTAGTGVHWPDGTYLVTDLLPSFWDVPHTGNGVIQRGSNVHHITPRNGDINTIWVDGQNGIDDANHDGLFPESAIQSLGWLNDIINAIGTRALAGQWTCRLVGTLTGGRRFGIDPTFGRPLHFIGDTDIDGNPTTTINYDGNDIMAMWFEDGHDVRLENLIGYGFQIGFNGYGFGIKSGGIMRTFNCRALNCDTGFGVVNASVGHFDDTLAENCQTGYRAQYSSAVTWGALDTPATARACDVGFYCTRNSIAHLDYCYAEDCTIAGMNIDMAARVNAIESNFKRNAVGVQTEGAAEWVNNDCIFNHGTADANTVPYVHYGVSREQRRSATSVNEVRHYGFYDTVQHSGTTSSTALHMSSDTATPELLLGNSDKKVRLRMWGTVAGTGGTKKLQFYSFDNASTNSVRHGEVTLTAGQTGFVEVVSELIPVSFTAQKGIVKGFLDGASVEAGAWTTARDFAEVRSYRPYCVLAAAGDSFTMEGFEVYVTG